MIMETMHLKNGNLLKWLKSHNTIMDDTLNVNSDNPVNYLIDKSNPDFYYGEIAMNSLFMVIWDNPIHRSEIDPDWEGN